MGISRDIVEAEGSEEMLKVIFEGARKLFDVEACGLALLDGNGALAFLFASGPGRKGMRASVDQGFCSWVLRHDQPLLSNAPASDPRYREAADSLAGKTPHSVLFVPLLVHSHAIGVLRFVNTRNPRGFQAEDLALMEGFAVLAAAAIKKTEYLQVVKQASYVYQAEERRRNRLVGVESQAMKEAMKMARIAAESASTVLLMCESGTGKELTARSIHRWSRRADAPFVAVNCVALTPELLASELFGHEKGAFTGAVSGKAGKFELANGGTIFLDEIGELSPDLQAKLLRVLQEREFHRVGGNKNIRVDVRIIAATNRNLRQEVKEGRFREDLFYRLNVVTIELPPLRERAEDLPELIRFFLGRYCRETGRPLLQLAPEAERAITQYPWPGNVRQLQNTIERAVVLSRGPVITREALPPELLGTSEANRRSDRSLPSERYPGLEEDVPMAEAMALFQKEKVRRALTAARGVKALAAKKLGLQPPNFSRLLKRLGESGYPDARPQCEKGEPEGSPEF